MFEVWNEIESQHGPITTVRGGGALLVAWTWRCYFGVRFYNINGWRGVSFRFRRDSALGHWERYGG